MRKKSVKLTRIIWIDRTCRMVNEADIEEAVKWTMRITCKIGFRDTESCMIGTAVCELARNIQRYATTGGVIHITQVRRLRKSGVEIVAVDSGPGIKDIKKAMQDHYSTMKGSLGIGLPGVKRLMDEFKIKSGKGTTVLVRKWVK